MEEEYNFRAIILSFLGPLLTFFTLMALQNFTVYTFLNGSFGAAVVINFALQSPAGRPLHVLFGQMIAGFVGIIFRNYIFNTRSLFWISTSFAVPLVTLLLKILKISYPPAGATAFILTQSLTPISWWYILFPLIMGNIIFLVISFFTINVIFGHIKYPDKLH